jgi:ABC-type uncharacterized transport system involved in gliding motility auxiliary subunit
MSGRAARHWARLALEVALLLVGVALLQVVAERTNRRFDLTFGRELSLSIVTTRVLGELERPLHVTVFHRRGDRQQYAGLLDRLHGASPLVEYELLDLDRHPERARAAGIAEYGRAALEYDGRHVTVPALPEEQLAGGILRVLRGTTRRVFFTAGHGERGPEGGSESYARLAAALVTENYRPDSLSLTADDVPADATLVVVAGPRHDFLPPEIERLASYLKNGGSVLFLLEPGSLPNLAELLRSMGIKAGDDVIVDRERSIVGTDGLAAVVELFKRGNPISEPDGKTIGAGAVLPSARSVDVTGAVPGVDAEPIARTGPTAWAMADVERARREDAPSEAAHDVPGGASVVVMAEVGAPHEGTRRGRVVVVGDADFASDAYLDLLGNRDLALNAVAWLAEEAALAGARTTPVAEIARPLSPLVLTETEARALLFGTAVLQPGLLLVVGAIVVGLRRRA